MQSIFIRNTQINESLTIVINNTGETINESQQIADELNAQFGGLHQPLPEPLSNNNNNPTPTPIPSPEVGVHTHVELNLSHCQIEEQDDTPFEHLKETVAILLDTNAVTQLESTAAILARQALNEEIRNKASLAASNIGEAVQNLTLYQKDS